MPPFQPRLENDRDLTNFPPEFTDEPVHLTPDEDRIIEKIDQSEFEGFEYVNPLLMTFDDCVWHNSNCQYHPNYSMQVNCEADFFLYKIQSTFLIEFQNYEDSSEYDSVADEMNLLHLREMQPTPKKNLVERMFCLPLN